MRTPTAKHPAFDIQLTHDEYLFNGPGFVKRADMFVHHIKPEWVYQTFFDSMCIQKFIVRGELVYALDEKTVIGRLVRDSDKEKK